MNWKENQLSNDAMRLYSSPEINYTKIHICTYIHIYIHTVKGPLGNECLDKTDQLIKISKRTAVALFEQTSFYNLIFFSAKKIVFGFFVFLKFNNWYQAYEIMKWILDLMKHYVPNLTFTKGSCAT
jgi:hypothetical protein